MPFGLKNTEATFQHMVNKIFKELIGHIMKVYVDDMLMKSRRSTDHAQHLSEALDRLQKYKVRLNAEKYTFGVAFGNILGYLVTQNGIKANPDQLSAIMGMKSPTYVKEVQMLNGRLAALNRFLNCSMDKCKLFFQAINKNGVDFRRNENCEATFQGLKKYLASPSYPKPSPEKCYTSILQYRSRP